MVHQLCYVSAATRALGGSELARILLEARVNNQRLGVSGVLVHHEGSFFQVLEGELTPVEALFAKIGRDPRHHRVAVLGRESVAARSFGDWTMGFVESSQVSSRGMPGFNDFFRRGFELTRLSETPGRVKTLMQAFHDGRFRPFVAS